MLSRDRCLIIAEIAQAHDGSLGTAHAYIDAAKRAGADAIKFQTHFASEESTPAEPWRVKFSRQDESRYDYWRRMEFSPEQWAGLKEHCDEAGIAFLSSAFSPKAVDLLASLDMAAWKIASGEVTNRPMLERILQTGRPVILSSGMSGWEDLDASVALVQRAGVPLAVLQCTTMYPTPADKVGLNVLDEIAERYGCLAGLSDHSGTIYASLAAAARGAKVLEMHIAFSRDCFGPDVSSSLTLEELKQLVEGIRFIETALANPVSKADMAASLSGTWRLFSKSVVASQDLEAGTVLSDQHLALKKPGGGYGPNDLSLLVGRTLKTSLPRDAQLEESHLS